MTGEPTYLVLGAGRLFFDRFAPGTKIGQGEVWLGNATEFSVNRDVAFVDKYASVGGIRVVERSIPVEERQTFRITCDAINADNVALWFSGVDAREYQAAIGIVTEALTVQRGRHYQLGLSIRAFVGLKHIASVTVLKAGVPINATSNYDLDRPAGRIQIFRDAVDINDADSITITFQVRAAVRDKFVPAQPLRTVEGALRFVSDNLYGPNKHYYFPSVKIVPGRDLSLLQSTQWQTIDFSGEAYRLNAGVPFHFVEEDSQVALSLDEQAILGEGSADSFLYVEELFNSLINYVMPSHDY